VGNEREIREKPYKPARFKWRNLRQGIKIPHEGRISCASGDYVYIMEEEKLAGQDQFISAKLHR